MYQELFDYESRCITINSCKSMKICHSFPFVDCHITFNKLCLEDFRGGTIQYLAYPIHITIHDTRSNTYHDTLLFRKTCKTTFNICEVQNKTVNFFSCRCILNHSPFINGYAKALPYHRLASNWLC